MKKWTLIVGIIVGLLIMEAVVVSLVMGRADAQETQAKPNIVFILSDDQRADEMEYMPNTNSLIGGEGTTFTNSFVTLSQCCPSRSTALTGMYAHNHDVRTNNANTHGGLTQFNQNGLRDETIAVQLHDAGYHTGLFGKYLNGCDNCAKPPGWDEWATGQVGTGYSFDHADSFVKNNAASDKPFFLWVSPKSPHTPLSWPNSYNSYYPNASVPRVPSINEPDMSDKPSYMRSNGTKNMSDEDKARRSRARMLAFIDDRIGKLVKEIKDAGEWENTVFVFASDNGYLQGEHRAVKKNMPYEESIRVPLLMKGPGIPVGESSTLVLNNDYAPTFAEFGGTTMPRADGRSLVPLFGNPDAPWRNKFGIEFYGSSGSDTPSFSGVRTVNEKYVEYKGGETEYYDLEDDPYEERSASGDGGLKAASDALANCAGEACRAAEDSTT